MEHIELEYWPFDNEDGIIDYEHLDAVLESTTPDKMAYYLTYSNTEFGTELLDEPLKYRELGGI